MKLSKTILICTIICLLLFNFWLLHLHQQDKNKLGKFTQNMNRIEHLKEVEFMFKVAKEITATRFKYEQCSIDAGTHVYIGSDKNVLTPIHSIVDCPKLVLGLNQDMCSPCVYGVLDDLKSFFSITKTIPTSFISPI